MSSLSNLMKYRFQKKEREKLGQSHQSPGDKTTPTKNANVPGVIPDTPEAKRPSPRIPDSPVFSKMKAVMSCRKNARVIKSDSEDDASSPVKKDSSPWLSKEYGMQMNGHAENRSIKTISKKSFTDSSPSTSGQSSSWHASQSSVPSGSTSSQESQEEARFHERLQALKEMFPNKPRGKTEKIARKASNLERAIDMMICLDRKEEMQNKRKTYTRIRQMSGSSTHSSDSDDPQPPRKRAKPMQFDDSLETDSQEVDTNEPKEEQIQFLYEAFPDFPPEAFDKALVDSNGDVEQATVLLSGMDPKDFVETGPVSQTENVGSIKAFQARRAQARKQEFIELSSSDDEVVEIRSSKEARREELAERKKERETNGQVAEEVEIYDSEDSEAEQEGGDTAAQRSIIKFFNNAEMEELISMPGCSKKKADAVISMRPYTNWADMAEKFVNSKVVSLNLIHGCKEVIKIREVVLKLMQNCETLAQEMEYRVSILGSNTTLDQVENTDENTIFTQPKLLNENYQLKPYQMVGLNWLMLMHNQELNGILADEMGLGKTIQTIAFLAQLLEEGEEGPHVIIAPSSTLDNWLRELQLWCPHLKILLYYGNQDERRDIRCQIMSGMSDDFHVVLTTYTIATSSVEDRVLFKKLGFSYAIFDEGHMLKNMASLRFQNLMKIKAHRRLLLTGTPLQNNLVELMSLLCFVMPEMFGGKTDYLKKMFAAMTHRDKDNKSTYEQNTIAQAKRIMKPFVLRRIKAEVLQQLPKKITKVELLPMSFEQQDLYDELKAQFTQRLEDRDDKTCGRFSHMVMQLRKAANHHLLHRRQFDETRLRQMAKLMLNEPTHSEANEQYIFEDMEVMSDFELHRLCKQYYSLDAFQLDQDMITDSGKFRFLDELLPEMKEKGDRILLFSQFTMMLDIIEVYMKSRGYKYFRLDGSTAVADRQEMIDKFNNDGSVFVFLLSTRAGGLGINLTAANVVILHDLDYNPYNDKQAEDRSHRVGQTRDVTVYRLVSRNSIEQAIYQCAESKLKLEQDITGATNNKDETDSVDVASLLKQALQMVSE